MSTKAVYNFEIKAGETFSKQVVWKDEAGVVFDLTGYTARCQFRRLHTDAAAALELTTTNGKIVITALEGKVVLSLTAVETAALSDEYIYDLELVSGAGVVTRILQGNILVDPEVTK